MERPSLDSFNFAELSYDADVWMTPHAHEDVAIRAIVQRFAVRNDPVEVEDDGSHAATLCP